jgi:hypothetical protein
MAPRLVGRWDCPTVRPSDRPTLRPSDRPTLRLSDPPTVRPSDCPTLRPPDPPTVRPPDRPTVLAALLPHGPNTNLNSPKDLPGVGPRGVTNWHVGSRHS